MLLLGAFTSNDVSSLVALAELRRRNPTLIVYVCARHGSSLLRQVTDYARAGADRLFTIIGRSDAVDLVEQVRERTAAPPPDAELRAVGTLNAPSHLVGFVEYVFRNAYQPRRMSDVGRAFGRDVRRIDEDLQHVDLPALRDLWRCGQYSHLVELERRGVTDANERARRTHLGTAMEATKFRYRLRVAIRRKQRLAFFAARISSLALLL